MTYQMPTESQRLAVESFRKFLDAEIAPLDRKYVDRFIPTDGCVKSRKWLPSLGCQAPRFAPNPAASDLVMSPKRCCSKSS